MMWWSPFWAFSWFSFACPWSCCLKENSNNYKLECKWHIRNTLLTITTMKLSPRVVPGALHSQNRGACDWWVFIAECGGLGKAGNFTEEYYFVFIMCSWFLLDQELFWDVTILRELQAAEGILQTAKWLWARLWVYAPINVNPVGVGGVRARGGDLTNFKIFRSNSPGWETKGQSKVSKKPPPQGKNLNKQYYNTI